MSKACTEKDGVFKVDDRILRISSHQVISARVPLVKCTCIISWEVYDDDDEPDLAFHRTDLQVDIVFDNVFGVLNSRMISTYFCMHPLVKRLGKLVKLWAKNRLLSAPPKNLSPYAWMVLVIFFLQQHQGLPNLQDVVTSPQTQTTTALSMHKHKQQQHFQCTNTNNNSIISMHKHKQQQHNIYAQTQTTTAQYQCFTNLH